VIYKLYPGCNIPWFVYGDTAIIGGKEFRFLGEAAFPNKIPMEVGLYRISSNNTYILRHSTCDKDIISEYQGYHLEKIVEDLSPVKRERQDKEIFCVPIYPEDNQLKVILKKVFFTIQVDLRDYRHKFSSDNHINNMKRLITGPANLSYEKFSEFLDILGLNCNIEIYNGKTPLALKEKIEIPEEE
jgi:hypothetical protein